MRKRIWVPLVAVGAAPFVAVVALVCFTFLTYTTGGEVEVRNDESQTVEFQCPLMDAPSATPSQTAPIELESIDRYQSCLVYYLDGPDYLGCITIDTHRISDGSTILLSTHLKREPISKCN